MIRHCDGKDQFLVKMLEDGTTIPCDCGRTFDDINYMVVYPHREVKNGRR